MRAKHLKPFIAAFVNALASAGGDVWQRGAPALHEEKLTVTREVTAMVEVRGDLSGLVMCSLSSATARALACGLEASAEDAGTLPGVAAVCQLLGTAVEEALAELQAMQCSCAAQPVQVDDHPAEPIETPAPVLIIPIATTFGDVDLGLSLWLTPRAGADLPPRETPEGSEASR